MPPGNQKKKKGRGKVYQKKIEPTLPMKSKEKKKKKKGKGRGKVCQKKKKKKEVFLSI